MALVLDWLLPRIKPDENKCCVCSKKSVTQIVIIESADKKIKRGFCGTSCRETACKQYDEYLGEYTVINEFRLFRVLVRQVG